MVEWRCIYQANIAYAVQILSLKQYIWYFHRPESMLLLLTLWVAEWKALGERSTEWRDRGIIPNEHLASGTEEPWSTWRSLNRLRLEKGRCWAMMKMWKLSYRCMWLWGETYYGSSYDMCWCPQMHADRRGYANPCQCQLCQTLGGICLTVTIEDSVKKKNAHITSRVTRICIVEFT